MLSCPHDFMMTFKFGYRLVPVRNVVIERQNAPARGRRPFPVQNLFMAVLGVLLMFTIVLLVAKIKMMDKLRVKFDAAPPLVITAANLSQQITTEDSGGNPTSTGEPILISMEDPLKKSQVILIPPVTEEPLTLWRRPTLLNKTFQWVMNNDSLCRRNPPNSKKQLVPILIHTARHHFQNRVLLRQTWLSIRDTYKNWDVRPVFLLGDRRRGPLAEIEWQRLRVEQDTYGDLVMGDFLDTYKNLSYKHLMGYKWILNYCSNATFVVKTDDDVFIDLYQLLDMREEEFKRFRQHGPSRSTTPMDMYCITFEGTWPQRDKDNKWYVSVAEWPDPLFPYYCSGTAYGITVDLIRRLYAASLVTKFLWVDDVFATGILRQAMETQTGVKVRKRDIYDHLTDELQDDKWIPFCETALRMQKLRKGIQLMQSWGLQRPFKTVVALPQKMPGLQTCLWNKVLLDRNVSTVLDRIVASQDNIHRASIQ